MRALQSARTGSHVRAALADGRVSDVHPLDAYLEHKTGSGGVVAQVASHAAARAVLQARSMLRSPENVCLAVHVLDARMLADVLSAASAHGARTVALVDSQDALASVCTSSSSSSSSSSFEDEHSGIFALAVPAKRLIANHVDAASLRACLAERGWRMVVSGVSSSAQARYLRKQFPSAVLSVRDMRIANHETAPQRHPRTFAVGLGA